MERWLSFASDADAEYDEIVEIDGASIEPTVTWGISPDQNTSINGATPDPASARNADERKMIGEALEYMKFPAGRISDFREVAALIKGRHVAPGIRALAVPGSQMTARQCEEEGIADIFREAGFEWRLAGCSMCLAMNPDKLQGDQLCASSSNRNFKGRQGSPTGRTLLMSPAMVAAAALTGKVSDTREVFSMN